MELRAVLRGLGRAAGVMAACFVVAFAAGALMARFVWRYPGPERPHPRCVDKLCVGMRGDDALSYFEPSAGGLIGFHCGPASGAVPPADSRGAEDRRRSIARLLRRGCAQTSYRADFSDGLYLTALTV